MLSNANKAKCGPGLTCKARELRMAFPCLQTVAWLHEYLYNVFHFILWNRKTQVIYHLTL